MSKSILINFKDIELDKIQSFNIEADSQAITDGIIFEKNIISKIEFVKHNLNNDENLFIQLYTGNLEIATIVTKNDYVISIDDGPIKDYYLRKAEEYDYK